MIINRGYNRRKICFLMFVVVVWVIQITAYTFDAVFVIWIVLYIMWDGIPFNDFIIFFRFANYICTCKSALFRPPTRHNSKAGVNEEEVEGRMFVYTDIVQKHSWYSYIRAQYKRDDIIIYVIRNLTNMKLH